MRPPPLISPDQEKTTKFPFIAQEAAPQPLGLRSLLWKTPKPLKKEGGECLLGPFLGLFVPPPKQPDLQFSEAVGDTYPFPTAPSTSFPSWAFSPHFNTPSPPPQHPPSSPIIF